MQHVELPITGMTCASCASRVERSLNDARRRDGDRELRHRARDGRLRPGRRRRPSSSSARSRPSATARCLPEDGAPAEAADRGRRDSRRFAAAPADRRARRSSLPVLLAVDGPAAAVRQLAVARARARHAGRAVGRLAVPPRRPGRTCEHGTATMDTLISLGTLAAWLLVAVRAVPRGRRDDRHAHGVRRCPVAGDGADEIYLETAVGRHDLHPRRPLLRGARQAPRGRRAPRAARARRQGRRGARRRRRRAPRADRAARGRRPLRRAPGREGRDRRRRRGRAPPRST